MLSRADEKVLHGLHRRKSREQAGLFLAEGVRVVEELAASSLDLVLVAISPSLEDTPRGRALSARLAERARVIHVSEAELARVAATDSPQGVVAAARMPRADLRSLPLPARASCLVLDGVQDPGNVGTLVRTADAFGVAAVIALPGTADPWNPKVVRASAGSSFRIPIAQLAASDALAWLRDAGFRIWVADAAGTPVEALAPVPRVALVAGNEGAGPGDETAVLADTRVAVPIRGRAESLNVAVATGILLYVTTREP
jgi:TrmH family RNA methyltransferase